MLVDTGWVSNPILFVRFNCRRVVFLRILWGSEAKQKFSVVWKNFGECIEVCVRDTFRNTFSTSTHLPGMECFSWGSFSRNTHFVYEVQWKMSGFSKNTPRILVRKYFGEYFEDILRKTFSTSTHLSGMECFSPGSFSRNTLRLRLTTQLYSDHTTLFYSDHTKYFLWPHRVYVQLTTQSIRLTTPPAKQDSVVRGWHFLKTL